MTLTKYTFLIALAVVTAASAGSAVTAQQDAVELPGPEPDTIVGVWRTRVRPVNCATGEVVPVPPIRGLFTFHQGGTTSEYGIGPGVTPALRSPGQGKWQREPGWQDYSYSFTYNRYDASGVFIGSTTVTSALVLNGGGDEFTSNSAIEALDANDNLVATGCARATGTRF